MKRNWRIILGAALLTAIIIVLMFSFRPSRLILVYSLPLCDVRTEKIIESLVNRDFPVSWNDFFTSKIAGVMAVHNTRCGSEENTANFAVILEDGSKILFGIFHIYFSSKGKFIHSTAAVRWKEFPDRNDPRIDAAWKNFIQFMQTVHPEETNPTHN